MTRSHLDRKELAEAKKDREALFKKLTDAADHEFFKDEIAAQKTRISRLQAREAIALPVIGLNRQSERRFARFPPEVRFSAVQRIRSPLAQQQLSRVLGADFRRLVHLESRLLPQPVQQHLGDRLRHVGVSDVAFRRRDVLQLHLEIV